MTAVLKSFVRQNSRNSWDCNIMNLNLKLNVLEQQTGLPIGMDNSVVTGSKILIQLLKIFFRSCSRPGILEVIFLYFCL
jgi:hypothetical protein